MSKKCPHCNQPLPKASSFCLHCFKMVTPLKEVATPKQKSHKKQATAAIILTAIIAVSAISAYAISFDKAKEAVKFDTSAPSVSVMSTKEASVASTTDLTSTTELTTTTEATQSEATTEQTSEAASTEQTQPAPAVTEATTRATTISKEIIISSGVLKLYPSARSNSSYTIPYDVTKIADGAFERNTHLKSLKFSKRENLQCNWAKLFSALPNLKTIYIYAGTSADIEGMQYFDGEIVYYD